MTPAARVQAAIRLLDAIVTAARGAGAPADRILAEWFRGNRFAGSGDRRAIRELVYRAIRVCGPIPQTGRAAMLRLAQSDPALLLAFDGSRYGPEPVKEGELVAEGGLAPGWLVERLARSGVDGADAMTLLDRAPLDIRVNALKARRDTLALPLAGEPLPSRHGLRYPVGTPVEQWPAFREGLIEVQDCGSQLACEAVAVKPGETVVDLCAGAGGKTLALAAEMDGGNGGGTNGGGVLIAADSDRMRLARLAPRAARAGAAVNETVLLDPGREQQGLAPWLGRADAVLVDAPCSGSGTWRRNPEARWRLDERRLEQLVALQARLLDVAEALVRPGGRLVYVICSLLDEEGPEQVGRFFARHDGWRAEPVDLPIGEPRGAGRRLTPWRGRTDGFFIARLGKA